MEKNITHVMVDIETVGRPPDGGIIAVGAVAFNPTVEPVDQEWNRTFEVIFDLEDVVRRGGRIEPSTMKWWLKQNEVVRDRMFNGTSGVVRGLRNFASWYREQGPTVVWAFGSIFDISMLDYTMAKNSVNIPWHFRDVRDTRIFDDLADANARFATTVNNLYENLRASGQQHDALQDAVVQAKQVCWANSVLRIY